MHWRNLSYQSALDFIRPCCSLQLRSRSLIQPSKPLALAFPNTRLECALSAALVHAAPCAPCPRFKCGNAAVRLAACCSPIPDSRQLHRYCSAEALTARGWTGGGGGSGGGHSAVKVSSVSRDARRLDGARFAGPGMRRCAAPRAATGGCESAPRKGCVQALRGGVLGAPT